MPAAGVSAAAVPVPAARVAAASGPVAAAEPTTGMGGVRRVFLVRHGRTVLNAQDRLRGLADPPLDDFGRAQAAAVAAALPIDAVTVVFSSPLRRAVATAQIVAARFGVGAVADPRFNDRDYGPWTGELRADVIARFGSVDAAPGVEPVDAVMARVRPALDAVLAEHPAGNVVIVSHDAVITPLVRMLGGPSDVVIATGSWTELQRAAGVWAVISAGNQPSAPTP